MLKFKCSKCQAVLAVPVVPASGKIGCPHCGSVLQIAAPSAAPPGLPAASTSSKRMQAPMVEPSGISRKPQPVEPARSAPPPRRPMEAPRRGPATPNNTTTWLILGGGAVGLVLLLVVVLVSLNSGNGTAPNGNQLRAEASNAAGPNERPRPNATMPPRRIPPRVLPRREPEPSADAGSASSDHPDDKVAANDKPARSSSAGGASRGSGSARTSGEESTEQPETFVTGGGGGDDDGVNVYPYVMKSAAFILVAVPPDNIAAGSGSLIDRKNRLVLTNHHVAGDAVYIAVFFPKYDSTGKLIAEQKRYFDQFRSRRDIIEAKVIASDKKRDLCIIQLERLPPGVDVLPLAKDAPAIGQKVHSVGNPVTSGALWVYAPGVVRQVYRRTWRAGDVGRISNHEAEIIETQSPTNHGDSGGPLVNNRGELVGVTQGGTRGEGAQVSIFISVNEVRQFVEAGVRDRLRTAFAPEKRPLLASGGGRPVQTASLSDIVKRLDSSDSAVRNKAIEELGRAGPAAKDAIAVLLKILSTTEDDFTRRTTLTALEKIGLPPKSDVRLLAETLASASPEARRYAATTLEKMGGDARGAAQQLFAALRDSEPQVRQAALRAIGNIGPEMKEQVRSQLEEMLGDPDLETRQAAATAWTAILSASRDVASLRKLLKHQDTGVRRLAALGLAQLGNEAKAYLPELLELAKGDTGPLRVAVLKLAGSLEGADAKLAANLVTEALKATDADTRHAALAAAAKLGKELPVAAIADIKTLLVHDDSREAAMTALGKLGVYHRAAAQALGELLKDCDSQTEDKVLKYLAEMGPGAQGAINEMIAGMEIRGGVVTVEDRDRVQKMAAAIAKIGRAAVPALRKELSSSRTTRWGAAVALGNLGPAAKDAVRDLQQAYQREVNAFIRVDMEDAYRKITNR